MSKLGATGVYVTRREGEPIEIMIKRFKKKYAKSGIAQELKDKMFYDKPSQQKRKKRLETQKRLKREKQKLEGTNFKKKKKKKKRKGVSDEYESSDGGNW